MAAASHAPFAVLNRTVNPVMKRVLRSPLHRLLSRRLVLLTVTGRKSGREFTFPVRYGQAGETLTIVPSKPEAKRWWRNLRGEGAPVRVRLRGAERTGHGRATGSSRQGVTVTVRLDPA